MAPLHATRCADPSPSFVESLTTEPSLTALHQHLARAGGAVVGALSLGVKGFVGEAGAVARDLVGRILPSLGEVFRAVPLPRWVLSVA